MYVIDKIRKKDGSIHEREKRRKGHRVFIANVSVGAPLELIYVDDGDKVLRTTPLEEFNANWNEAGRLVARTRNTIYEFSKLVVNDD